MRILFILGCILVASLGITQTILCLPVSYGAYNVRQIPHMDSVEVSIRVGDATNADYFEVETSDDGGANWYTTNKRFPIVNGSIDSTYKMRVQIARNPLNN